MKRAKPIKRKELEKELDTLNLMDLYGATLSDLKKAVQSLINKHGGRALIRPDGEPYEGYDRIAVYLVALESDEDFQERRKKILKARRNARREELAEATKLAQLRERSRKAAAAHPQLFIDADGSPMV